MRNETERVIFINLGYWVSDKFGRKLAIRLEPSFVVQSEPQLVALQSQLPLQLRRARQCWEIIARAAPHLAPADVWKGQL